MRLWPRSLFGRTAVVITALAVLSQILSAILLHFYYVGPRQERAALAVGREIKTLALMINTLAPPQRNRLFRDLEKNQNIRIYPGETAPGVAAAKSYWMREFEFYLRAEFDRPVEIHWQQQLLWVRWRDPVVDFWIGVPRLHPDRDLYWPVAGRLLLGGVLGLLGALWIARRINRPLSRLTHAAALVGRGEVPRELPESGPLEIVTLSRAFNQMVQDVQRLSADRTLLLAGVSHDLRTPLARLRLALEMLDDNADATLTQGMIQDVDDMDHIVEQFLSYVRDGEMESVRLVDLNELVQTTAARYLRQGHAIAVDILSLPRLPMRRVAMQRLLSNLIDNALLHGGGEVEVNTRGCDGGFSLSVLDRGPGLGASSPTNPESAYRSRLGLIVVERIAQLHKGRLQLLARDGGGLEARVVFSVSTLDA